jgi:hypothetical protein
MKSGTPAPGTAKATSQIIEPNPNSIVHGSNH